jgi:hypothetical protein
MKKTILALVCFGVLLSANTSFADCAKIKSGSIIDTAGNPVTLGNDQFGYNYQAHLFNGTYDSSDRVLDGLYFGSVGDYTDDNLIMKWSDEWLSNVDCNGDNLLDRGLNSKTGVATGASMGWLTNQIEGDYIGTDGDSHHYTYFAKIVFDNGAACTSGSPSCLWGTFSLIEEVYNDPFGGYHGMNRSMLSKPAGFGYYTNGH